MLVTIVDRIDLGRLGRKVAIRIDVTASRRNKVGRDDVTATPCQHTLCRLLKDWLVTYRGLYPPPRRTSA